MFASDAGHNRSDMTILAIEAETALLIMSGEAHSRQARLSVSGGNHGLGNP